MEAVGWQGWRALTATGYCAATTGPGDCTNGQSGSFGDLGLGFSVQHPPRLRAGEREVGFARLSEFARSCLSLCADCGRCQYVSISLQHQDCSWYHSCDMSSLKTDVEGFLSGPALQSSRGVDAAWTTLPPPGAEPQFSRMCWRPGGVFLCDECGDSAGLVSGDAKLLEQLQPTVRQDQLRVAILQTSDGPPLSALDLKMAERHRLSSYSAWAPTGGALPCDSGRLRILTTAAVNRAFARRHGYDYVEAQADCARQVGRAPTWCKVAVIYGLLDPSTAPKAYQWVVYLDTDAAINTLASLSHWLSRGSRPETPGQELDMPELLRSGCTRDGHRGADLTDACMVLGKDSSGWFGVNAGVVLARYAPETLRLMRQWWAWPTASSDGLLGARRWYENKFPYDQLALNHVETGILSQPDVAGCARVVPWPELFGGRFVRHFTGNATRCPVPKEYLPNGMLSDGEALPYNAQRKCRCMIGNYGAHTLARLYRNLKPFKRTMCQRRKVHIHMGGNSSRAATLVAVFSVHCSQPRARARQGAADFGSPSRRRVELTPCSAWDGNGSKLAPARHGPAESGYCAPTTDGDNGDCQKGDSGSFLARASGVDSLQACGRLCNRCRRCRYVSFNKEADDCSWFARCPKLHTNVAGFQSMHVPVAMGRSPDAANLSWKVFAAPCELGAPGMCGVTNHHKGNEDECEAEGQQSGAWPTRSHGIHSLSECVAKCRRCSRCAYVSYSREVGDCSWFTNDYGCKLNVLWRPPPFATDSCTVEVRKATRTTSPPSCKQQAIQQQTVSQTSGGGNKSRIRLGIVTVCVGSSTRCAVVQWCQGAMRLRAALPRGWMVQLVVIGPKRATGLSECPCASTESIDRNLQMALEGCKTRWQRERAQLEDQALRSSDAASMLRRADPTFMRRALYKWMAVDLEGYDAVLLADLDIDLLPAEQSARQVGAQWRANLPAFIAGPPDAQMLANGDFISPFNAGLFLVRPSRELYLDGLSVLRTCRFNFTHGWDLVGRPRELGLQPKYWDGEFITLKNGLGLWDPLGRDPATRRGHAYKSNAWMFTGGSACQGFFWYMLYVRHRVGRYGHGGQRTGEHQPMHWWGGGEKPWQLPKEGWRKASVYAVRVRRDCEGWQA